MAGYQIGGVDPGKKHVGWAVADDNGVIVRAGIFRVQSLWLLRRFLIDLDLEALYVERPRIRTHGQADPDDIVEVALVAGAAATTSPNAVFVDPAKWAGSVPKRIRHRRMWDDLDSASARNLRASLLPIKSKLRHNVLDAAGIVRYGYEQIR